MSETQNSGALTEQAVLARTRATRTALWCSGLVMTMTALAFASAPLYDLFCRVTGFGGTPMVRSEAASRMSDRVIQVRFDANVSAQLGWSFEAETSVIQARVGETRTVFYKVTNRSDQTTTGIAAFNVQPSHAGAHFVKMQCFCFTEHTLKPGESMEAPVVFYIDPDIEKNRDMRNIHAMTLSYTYFPSKNGQPVGGQVSEAAPAAAPKTGNDTSRL
ncbi:MAG: cytochrome c oxidase assembly protein [Beijerinckiaceae bacterium]|jgi:cytochrome c oxidase assembly protein subunit 11|nr:cytochrome c oxidase assembly protein [Beijerinckiaceae bacterium]